MKWFSCLSPGLAGHTETAGVGRMPGLPVAPLSHLRLPPRPLALCKPRCSWAVMPCHTRPMFDSVSAASAGSRGHVQWVRVSKTNVSPEAIRGAPGGPKRGPGGGEKPRRARKLHRESGFRAGPKHCVGVLRARKARRGQSTRSARESVRGRRYVPAQGLPPRSRVYDILNLSLG